MGYYTYQTESRYKTTPIKLGGAGTDGQVEWNGDHRHRPVSRSLKDERKWGGGVINYSINGDFKKEVPSCHHI